ncbi:MAG: hypothetical protein MRZ79_26675 [Bacteroidia bacterium]|nr:hypothetical protein [Bacteroidia bacterium]
MKNKAGSIPTYIGGIGVVLFGLVYAIKPSFMPYHAAAVEMPWEDVPYNFQRLFLTYMKAAASGWIALGVFVLYLQNKFNQNKEVWIPHICLTCAVIFATLGIYSAVSLNMTTPANPPIIPMFVFLTIFLVGFYFNLKYSKNHG